MSRKIYAGRLLLSEKLRIERNISKLAELWPTFEVRVRAMLDDLEDEGYRPRIQEAYRSPEEQMHAYLSGKSQFKYGFHNVEGSPGVPQALAVDVYDDDMPRNPTLEYILRLARAAQDQGLVTGIRWGLPMRQVDALNRTINCRLWHQTPKIGWDPLHVETKGVSVPNAMAGKRPE